MKQSEALQKIQKIWERLKKFAKRRDETNSSALGGEMGKCCGICLTNILEASLLEFSNTAYHKECANLWINRVDSLLPKLTQYCTFADISLR